MAYITNPYSTDEYWLVNDLVHLYPELLLDYLLFNDFYTKNNLDSNFQYDETNPFHIILAMEEQLMMNRLAKRYGSEQLVIDLFKKYYDLGSTFNKHALNSYEASKMMGLIGTKFYTNRLISDYNKNQLNKDDILRLKEYQSADYMSLYKSQEGLDSINNYSNEAIKNDYLKHAITEEDFNRLASLSLFHSPQYGTISQARNPWSFNLFTNDKFGNSFANLSTINKVKAIPGYLISNPGERFKNIGDNVLSFLEKQDPNSVLYNAGLSLDAWRNGTLMNGYSPVRNTTGMWASIMTLPMYGLPLMKAGNAIKNNVVGKTMFGKLLDFDWNMPRVVGNAISDLTMRTAPKLSAQANLWGNIANKGYHSYILGKGAVDATKNIVDLRDLYMNGNISGTELGLKTALTAGLGYGFLGGAIGRNIYNVGSGIQNSLYRYYNGLNNQAWNIKAPTNLLQTGEIVSKATDPHWMYKKATVVK